MITQQPAKWQGANACMMGCVNRTLNAHRCDGRFLYLLWNNYKRYIFMINQTKRKIPGSNGQYYVSMQTRKDWVDCFNWLNENGYCNINNIRGNAILSNPKVICIDVKDKLFYKMTLSDIDYVVSQGHRVINFEEFYIRHYFIKEVFTIDIQENDITIFCQNLDMRCEKYLYNYCFKLCFNNEDKEKLIAVLTNDREATEYDLLKTIKKEFYWASHVEDWFKFDEFLSFCQENNIKHTLNIVPIDEIEEYYK